MNPFARGLAALLRLVALGLLATGGLLACLEYVRARTGRGELDLARGLAHIGLALAGLLLLLGSGRLARRLTRYWDD